MQTVVCNILRWAFFPPSILVKFCHTADVFDMDSRGGLTVNETVKIKTIQQTSGRRITWTFFNLPIGLFQNGENKGGVL